MLIRLTILLESNIICARSRDINFLTSNKLTKLCWRTTAARLDFLYAPARSTLDLVGKLETSDHDGPSYIVLPYQVTVSLKLIMFALAAALRPNII